MAGMSAKAAASRESPGDLRAKRVNAPSRKLRCLASWRLLPVAAELPSPFMHLTPNAAN